jgi:WD40 repeat protein
MPTDEQFFLNVINHKTDDWEGIGISNLQFNPLLPNLLLCVTHKHYRMEVWDINQGRMVASMPSKRITQVEWSPHDPEIFLYITEAREIYIQNYETGTVI